MHELGAQRHQLVHPLQQVVGQLVAEPQRIRLVLVQRDGALAVPQPRALLQFNFVVFLGVAAGGLAPYLHGGVGHRLAVAHRAGQRAVLVPHLQQRRRLIPLHAHVLVIVGGIGVDLRPAVVGVFGGVAPAHRQVHGHHAVVHIISVQKRVVVQMLVVQCGGGGLGDGLGGFRRLLRHLRLGGAGGQQRQRRGQQRTFYNWFHGGSTSSVSCSFFARRAKRPALSSAATGWRLSRK